MLSKECYKRKRIEPKMKLGMKQKVYNKNSWKPANAGLIHAPRKKSLIK